MCIRDRCAASLIFIQLLIHGESVLGSVIRIYVIWILSLIIVRCLCLRPGFNLRYPLVLFAIGLTTIPFIGVNPGADMARVEISVQGGLTHPGGLAEWFGFFTIYFAIIGLETRRASFRIGIWLLAVGCLFIVTLTIERGPLFAT